MGFDIVSVFALALIGEVAVVVALALLLRSSRRAVDLAELHEKPLAKRFTK
jgi:hypothetical protein